MPEGKTGEIDRWIEDGLKAGLLVCAREASPPPSANFRRQNFSLTKRLKEAEKVQTAYLCGKRAVELKPEDWDAWYDLGESPNASAAATKRARLSEIFRRQSR